jgi:hypothetical protein
MLEEALRLLPTPTATEYGSNQSPSPAAAVRPSLPALAIALLPTPRAAVDKEHGPNGKHWSELKPTIETLPLLPTPKANDGLRLRQASAGEGFGRPLEQVLVEWPLSGGRSSRPSGAGKQNTDLRLNPLFGEWMIGLPPGWSDPECPLSATEFKSRSATSSAAISSTSNVNAEVEQYGSPHD